MIVIDDSIAYSHLHTWFIVNYGCHLARVSLIQKKIQAIFARGDDIESATLVDVSNRKMDAASFADANCPIVDYLFDKVFAAPFKVVDAYIIPFTGVISIVGAVPFAGDEFVLAISIDINPVQVVVLGVIWVDGVVMPRAIGTAFAPPQSVAVCMAGDEFVLTVPINIHD